MRKSQKPPTPPPASVKVQFKYPTCLLPDQFPELTCILPISVGQPYHGGDVFLETVKNISKSFGRVIIVLADSLQRWTMAISQEGVNPESLRAEANQKGIEWKEKNEEAINLLQAKGKLVEILRWDDIMRHPAIIEKLSELNAAYAEGEEVSKHQQEEREQNKHSKIFYEKVEASIGSFYGKKHLSMVGFDAKSRFASCSREYLLEESAAFLVFPNIGCLLGNSELTQLRGDCLAYPTRLNQVMYLLLEQINNGREYRILTPIEIVVTMPKKTGTFSPPTVDEREEEESSPRTVLTPQAFFGAPRSPTSVAASDSVMVRITQDDVSALLSRLSEFSKRAAELNGRLHCFQALFLAMLGQGQQMPESEFKKMMKLQEELMEALSNLSISKPQTSHTDVAFRSH